jgi:hypothetical protein
MKKTHKKKSIPAEIYLVIPVPPISPPTHKRLKKRSKYATTAQHKNIINANVISIVPCFPMKKD